MSAEDYCEAARTSNAALSRLAPRVQWQHSCVVAGKTFCVHLAEDEDAINEHADPSGFPVNIITEIRTVIDPNTANA